MPVAMPATRTTRATHATHAAGLCAAALAAATTWAPPALADIIGVSFSGQVIDIDSTTGAHVEVGDTGVPDTLNGMAKDSAGLIYTAGVDGNSGIRSLFTLNPASGAVTAVSTLNMTGVGWVSVRAMAFDASDTLYAINNGGDTFSTSGLDQLFRVNVATGIGTLVGANTGMAAIQGLSFGHDGTLYGWDGNRGLVKVDTATGLASDVNGLLDGSFDVQTLATAPDGRMFAGGAALYTVDTASGALSVVGGSFDVRGMEFVSSVPEPAAWATMVLGGVGLLGVARRRRARGSRPAALA